MQSWQVSAADILADRIGYKLSTDYSTANELLKVRHYGNRLTLLRSKLNRIFLKLFEVFKLKI